jgi:hypothetical protein
MATLLPPLIFVLDEAYELMADFFPTSAFQVYQKIDGPVETDIYGNVIQKTNGAVDTDVYRIIRRTLRSFNFFWDNTITITISTFAKVNEFYPEPTKDPSFRVSGPSPVMLKPIILKGTFDALCVGPINANFDSWNWMDYLFSPDRVLMITSCGRPLWTAHFGTYFKKAFLVAESAKTWKYTVAGRRQLVNFKIMPDKYFIEPIDKMGSECIHKKDDGIIFDLPADDQSMTAVLSFAVALEKIPSEVEIEELIRVCGMDLIRFDEDNRKAHGVYCSEGIINGCASYVLSCGFDNYVNALQKWAVRKDRSFLNLGEFGELFERMLLVKAVFNAKREGISNKISSVNIEQPRTICEILYEPVSFEDFLDSFCGAEVRMEYLGKCPELLGSMVAFTYFYNMALDEIGDAPYDAMANALSRGAGVVPKQGTPGCDCVIPLVLQNGDLSFVYIQTKIGSSYKSHPSPSEVRSCSPDERFTFEENLTESSEPQPKIAKKKNRVKPYAFIYHHLSDTKLKSKVIENAEDYHYPCLSLRGLREGKDLNCMREILNILYAGKNKEEDCAKNASLRNTWKFPRDNCIHEYSWNDSLLP